MADEKEKTPKEIDGLLEFLKEFRGAQRGSEAPSGISCCGHIVWKEKDKKKKANNKKPDEASENADESSEENSRFLATEFEFESSSIKVLADIIYEKLDAYKKYDEVESSVNKRLVAESYGYVKEWWQSYGILASYHGALTASSTSNNKKGLVSEGKNGRKELEKGSSFAIRFVKDSNGGRQEAVFIKLLKMKNALSSSRKKLILDLDRLSKAQNITNSVIIEPDSFDCAIFGDRLFIFHQVHFYYLFVPTNILRGVIMEHRNEIGKAVTDPDPLIREANKHPSKTRDLYYFVSNGSKIPEKNEIERDLGIIRNANPNRTLFEVKEDGRIDCDEDNASLVLAYISKKMGISISDKELISIEASSRI